MMSQLYVIITDAIEAGISDEHTIDLMVEEGLPREACPEILRTFKEFDYLSTTNQI
jgi:hypothetical protein